GAPKATERVLGQLVQWARWYNLLDVEPAARGGLRVGFTVKAPKSRGGGPPRPRDAADVLVQAGQAAGRVVENRSQKAAYRALLGVGRDGSVGVVYPPEGEQEALPAGETWQERVPVSVPKGRGQIRDHLKLFATPAPVDFRFLRQEGIKAIPRDADP